MEKELFLARIEFYYHGFDKTKESYQLIKAANEQLANREIRRLFAEKQQLNTLKSITILKTLEA